MELAALILAIVCAVWGMIDRAWIMVLISVAVILLALQPVLDQLN